jgi:hypothetical protein
MSSNSLIIGEEKKVFHESRLKKFLQPAFRSQVKPPSCTELELVNGEGLEYEVREVLAE